VRMLMSAMVAAVASVVLLAGCQEASPSQAPTSNPDGGRRGTAIPSPSPAVSQQQAAAGALEPLGDVKLPVDEGGHWFPLDLLQGTSIFFFEYSPRTHSREDRNAAVNRIAFFDAETGALNELGGLSPGDQVGNHANDGQFLAWTESPVVDMTYTGWRMFAIDLSTKEKWLVDSDDFTSPIPQGEFDHEPDIALDNGRLVYFDIVNNGTGPPVYELKMIDLKSRNSKILLRPEGDVLTETFSSVSLSGDTLIWFQTSEIPSADGTPPGELHEMNLSSGETRTLAQGGGVLRQDKVLYSVDASLHLLDLSTGEDKLIWGPYQEQDSLLVVPGYALWVERLGYTAMAYNMLSGQLINISGPYVQNLFVSGSRVYWLWQTSDGFFGKAPDPQLYVRWADLPAP
jgi:hypothetical protein